MIGKTIGNLRIISEIGKGGMGVVYLAEHMTLKKRFAVKSLSSELTQDPQFRERFYQEAQNQALLDHPNIVQATDFFEENRQFFFVMEYVDGQDLGELIRTKGNLQEKEALSILKDILQGLNLAHDKGIIHRDVKPSNILIDKSGRARIMDFGIAVMVGGQRLTATGTTVGSPCYMSPEQIIHPQNIDYRSDVYSAGIVLYEMLVGDVPFDAETDYAVQNQQVNTPTPDPCQRNPEISPELAQIILKAMDKAPDKRFQGCAEFLDSIKAYESSKEKTTEDHGKWLLWVLVAIAIACVGIAIYATYVIKTQDKNGGVIPAESIELKQEHKSAAILIEGTLKEVSILCREFKEIELKRGNLKIAEKVGDIIMFDKYSKQIQEQEQNIQDGISNYKDFIEKLASLKKTVVDEEFEKYNRHLVQENLSERVKINSLVKLHFQRYVNNKEKVNYEIMGQACMEK